MFLGGENNKEESKGDAATAPSPSTPADRDSTGELRNEVNALKDR